MKNKYSTYRGYKRITINEIYVNEGNGTKDDPVRRVIYWVKDDGTIIGHNDTHEDVLLRGDIEN